MTFLAQVIALIGNVPALDTTAVAQWLTDGARKLIAVLPISRLKSHWVLYSVTPGPTDLRQIRWHSPNLDGVLAKFVESADKQRFLDPASLHYPTLFTPICYMDNPAIGLLFFPATGNGYVKAITYPTVLATDTAIPTLPVPLWKAVVLYAAINGLNERLLSDLVGSLETIRTDANTAISGITFPAPPPFPVFVYSAVAAANIDAVTLIDLASHFTTALGYIETEEDIELGRAKLEEIANRLSEWVQESQLTLQRNIEVARQANDVSLQNELQELQRQIAEYRAIVEIYTASVQGVLGEISKEVQRGQLNIALVGGEAQIIQAQLQDLTRQYTECVQMFLQSPEV